MSRSIVSFALVAGLAVTASAPAAFAQGAGTPPAWDTLVRCAQTPDESERLACYDAAMHAAGRLDQIFESQPEAAEGLQRQLVGPGLVAQQQLEEVTH